MKTMITLLLAGITFNSYAQQNGATTTGQAIEPAHYERTCSGGQSNNVTGTRSVGTMYIIPAVTVPAMSALAIPQKSFGPPGHYKLTREEINNAPTAGVRDLTTLFPGTYQARRGDDISVYSSR